MKHFNRHLIFVFVTSITVSFFSCNLQNEDLLVTVREKGEIVVATEGEWRPWTYLNASGELEGFDIEVAKAIGEVMGLKVSFKKMMWQQITNAIHKPNGCDIAVNAIEYTPERARKNEFSIPYSYMKTVLITHKENYVIERLRDLGEMTTANALGSPFELIGEHYGARVSILDTAEEALLAVERRRADATLNSDSTFYAYLERNPDSKLRIVDTVPKLSELHIIASKSRGCDGLLQEINKAIVKLEREGVIREISIKYLGTDMSIENKTAAFR